MCQHPEGAEGSCAQAVPVHGWPGALGDPGQPHSWAAGATCYRLCFFLFWRKINFWGGIFPHSRDLDINL